MPAVLEDPTAPPIHGLPRHDSFSGLFIPTEPEIYVRQVTLRDRVTIATLVPFSSPHHVPHKLLSYLCELLNREIEKGDTYPMTDTMSLSAFGEYWFANFAAVMIMGDVQSVDDLVNLDSRNADWSKLCLGSFFIKPNYPGRSSHICNGGFLVTDAARNRGVGRLMGEGYIEWAPKLGYTYSMFNLVYETNVASLRIWDALGFKRIGRIKGAGNLKSHPEEFVDAIIFGRELGIEGDEDVSEERFDKIRFYLKNGTYPNGSDRAEKSRLRSAATHYRLIQGTSVDGSDDKLMLKDKEVVSDPHKQYEIARNFHAQAHGGINKTTATIAERYHWVRIKETVSAAIKNCEQCKDTIPKKTTTTTSSSFFSQRRLQAVAEQARMHELLAHDVLSSVKASHPISDLLLDQHQTSSLDDSVTNGLTSAGADLTFDEDHHGGYGDLPVDPQILEQIHQHALQHWDDATVTNSSHDHHDGLHLEGDPSGGVILSSLHNDNHDNDNDSNRIHGTNHMHMTNHARQARMMAEPVGTGVAHMHRSDHRPEREEGGGTGEEEGGEEDDVSTRLRETLEAEIFRDRDRARSRQDREHQRDHGEGEEDERGREERRRRQLDRHSRVPFEEHSPTPSPLLPGAHHEFGREDGSLND